jgi:hypothetical protein
VGFCFWAPRGGGSQLSRVRAAPKLVARSLGGLVLARALKAAAETPEWCVERTPKTASKAVVFGGLPTDRQLLAVKRTHYGKRWYSSGHAEANI